MYDLGKEIDEYSEELFADLGPVPLPEEKKADIYARLKERLHRVIANTFEPVLKAEEFNRIHQALDQEDYRSLARILKRYSQFISALKGRVESEFKNLKLTIAEEQKNAGSRQQTS